MTRYDGQRFSAKAEVCTIFPQTHISAADGLYVAGIVAPETNKGMGSFANHSSKPNAEKIRVGSAIVLRASKAIVKGDEVTLNYGPPGSEAYKVAMGMNRWVLSRRSDGSADVSVVPLHRDGDIVKVAATSAPEAVDKLASDLCALVVSPSPMSNGCFFRCVAILLTEMISSPRGLPPLHAKAVKDFLSGVDAAAIRNRGDDVRGLSRMRNQMALYVRSLCPVWGNILDPTAAGDDTTIGGSLMSLAEDEAPGFLLGMKALRASDRTGCVTPEEEATFALGKIADCIEQRTADCGGLAAFVASRMFGVDVHIYNVAK